MRLLLVSPTKFNSNGTLHKGKRRWLAGITLPYLAALTPQDVEVKCLDEYLDEVDFDLDCDLVGITFMSNQASRAYQIADGFRQRGKPVAMGGFHASAQPDEALEHCDAVVIGEAEPVWEDLIADSRRGKLKQIYKGDGYHDLRGLPSPRFDLLNLRRYKMPGVAPILPVQTTRGCPYRCRFCEVTQLYGGRYRFRPISEVIRDIQAARTKKVWFVDDNIAADREHARELFQAVKPLGIDWSGLCNLRIGLDEELLDLMVESGCVHLNIGLESISEASLRAMNKKANILLDYRKCLGGLRDHRIFFSINVMFGADGEDATIFEPTAQFLIEERVPMAFIFVQTPRVGTQLRADLEAEGRILHNDWNLYAGDHCVFQPKNISCQELEDGMWLAYRRFYSLSTMYKRLRWLKPRFLAEALAANLYFYWSVRRRMHPLSYY